MDELERKELNAEIGKEIAQMPRNFPPKPLWDLRPPHTAGISVKCEVCGDELLEDAEGHFVEIRRGYFLINDDDELELERIKCNLYICNKCYLEDIDLCRFFNKIGYNVR